MGSNGLVLRVEELEGSNVGGTWQWRYGVWLAGWCGAVEGGVVTLLRR